MHTCISIIHVWVPQDVTLRIILAQTPNRSWTVSSVLWLLRLCRWQTSLTEAGNQFSLSWYLQQFQQNLCYLSQINTFNRVLQTSLDENVNCCVRYFDYKIIDYKWSVKVNMLSQTYRSDIGIFWQNFALLHKKLVLFHRPI